MLGAQAYFSLKNKFTFIGFERIRLCLNCFFFFSVTIEGYIIVILHLLLLKNEEQSQEG